MKFDSAFNLSDCKVDPTEFSVKINGGEKQSLQPKFIEVLCYLAKHYPRIIPRDELIDNIWGPNSFVGDKSLTNAIWHLRKNLAEVNDGNDVIETIRKAGYRLVVEPQWLSCNEVIKTEDPNKTDHQINLLHEDAVTNIVLNEDLANKSLFQTHKKSIFNKQKKLFVLLVILITIFSATLMGYFLGKPSNNTSSITQITKHPGSELFPAPSPDGRYVVYSQVSINQPTNLFMKDTLHPELPAQQLTFDSAIERHSVWSNDGQYLYFSRAAKGKSKCKYIQLKVISRQEKQIADCPKSRGYYYLDISPDDKVLAIHDFNDDAEESGIYFLNLTKENASLERFSCKEGCDYKDRDMAFSPDGKYIAVSRRINRFSENIYLISLETKVTQQLTYTEEDIVGLTWIGKDKIIYATRKAGVRSGFIFNIDKKTSKPLKIDGFSYPSFTRKGKKLFYQQRQENSSIASLSLKTDIPSSPFPVVLSNFSHHSPDYSKTRKRFAYVSNESGFYELWSANTQGEERKQLTQLRNNITAPKWSHDGNSIAFLASSEEKKHNNIYIYSLLTQKISVLNSQFNQHNRHNRPSWTLDDKKIITAIYNDTFTDLFSITITDGAVERLTKDNARYGIMTSVNILLYGKVKRGLWQIDLTNKNKKPIKIIDRKEFPSVYSWDYYDNTVYFSKKLKDHHRIMSYDITIDQTKPLLKLPLNSFYSGSIIKYIPDEDSVMFTKSSYPQANINMLENSPLLQ